MGGFFIFHEFACLQRLEGKDYVRFAARLIDQGILGYIDYLIPQGSQ